MSFPEINIAIVSRYLPDQSDTSQKKYAFTYSVTITNVGKLGAQLIARHWIIVDSENKMHEVKGLGVVGKQPFLNPGESFEYSSWTVIATPAGSMRGIYICMTEDCVSFEVPIPEFVLAMPKSLH